MKKNKVFKFIALLSLLVFILSGCSKTKDEVVVIDANTINETQNQQNVEPTKPEEPKEEVKEPEVPEQKVPKISFERINLNWDETKAFGEGLIGYRDPQTELWGFADFNGNVVIDAKYRNVSSFENGIAKIFENQNEMFIDKQGNVVSVEEEDIPYEVESTTFDSYHNSPLIFDMTTKYGYIEKGTNDEPATVIKDEKSNIVVYIDDIKKIYPDFTGIGITDNYVSVMWTDGYEEKYTVTTAILDYNLNVIVEPNKYSYVLELDENHFVVVNMDKTYGIIDKTGKEVVEMSSTTVELMLDYEVKHNVGSEGYFLFNTKDYLSYSRNIYNYNVINNTGKNLVLLVDTIDYSLKSAKIYDLDKEEVIGYIPQFSDAAQAKRVFLLPNVVLTTDSMPHVCYDYNGNIIEQTVFPDYGYRVDEVDVVDEDTAVLQLAGSKNNQYMYIKISKK